MPIMPRKKGKVTRIARDVLGVPANMKHVRKSHGKYERDRKIFQQESARRYDRR